VDEYTRADSRTNQSAEAALSDVYSPWFGERDAHRSQADTGLYRDDYDEEDGLNQDDDLQSRLGY
jgi:hypothetical protein